MARCCETRHALDTVVEQLAPARRCEIVVAQSGVVPLLEEGHALREPGLLHGRGRVRELRDEVRDGHQLRRQRVPRAVPVHLRREEIGMTG